MNHLYDTTCARCDVTHKPSPESPCLCLLCSGCERPYPPALASYDYPGQECLSCMDLGRAGAPISEFPAEREAAEREAAAREAEGGDVTPPPRKSEGGM